ncbi:MAG: hypothetical protein AAF466_02370 [Bacteroidota bacterium]
MKPATFILLLASLFAISCEEGGVLFETDITEESVTLLAPTDGAQISSNTVRFDWTELENAGTYEIQIVTPNFESPEQFLVNQLLDSITFLEVPLGIDNYEWRVRGRNSSYESLFATAAFSVIPITNFSDNTVILTTPADNAITNDEILSFQWESIIEATQYRIQILEEGVVTSEETTASTEISLPVPEGALSWQVRAENGIESTGYSTRDLLIDRTVPNTPVLVLPADGTTTTDTEVEFQWTRELIPGSTEVDSIYVYRDSGLTDLVLKEQTTSPFNNSLETGTFYWLVQAFDEAGNQGTASDVSSFTVNTP